MVEIVQIPSLNKLEDLFQSHNLTCVEYFVVVVHAMVLISFKYVSSIRYIRTLDLEYCSTSPFIRRAINISCQLSLGTLFQ